jgi:hypothetical protein
MEKSNGTITRVAGFMLIKRLVITAGAVSLASEASHPRI